MSTAPVQSDRFRVDTSRPHSRAKTRAKLRHILAVSSGMFPLMALFIYGMSFLRLEPMLREALQGRILEYLHVHIRDLGAEPGQDEVFSTAAAPAAGDALQVRRVDFGGRRWELRKPCLPSLRRPSWVIEPSSRASTPLNA